MADFTPAEIVLQWSADPLSDTTPTWTTVDTAEIQSLEWWAGVNREGDDPQPGGMIVRLKNVGRKWEPLFGTNTIDTEQRFRLTLDGVAEGVWYTTDFELDFPADTGYSEVTITCSDGVEVLALDDLPELDPPDAQSYADVVGFDEPWGYWRLGDTSGLEAVTQNRIVKKTIGRGKRRRKIKVRRNVIVGYETAGAAGPTAIYKNSPQLGVAGLITGDSDPAIRVTTANAGWVQIPLEDVDQFAGYKPLSVEAWFTFASTPSAPGWQIVAGPENASNLSTWWLAVNSTPRAEFGIRDSAGVSYQVQSSTLTVGGPYHAIGVWDGNTLRIYVDGVRQSLAGISEKALGGINIQGGDTGEFASIARDETNAVGFIQPADLTVDEVALYTTGITDERALAHYQAGAERGFLEQTAGARISAIATSDLWAETEIQTTGRDVIPQMMFGQARLEEIAEAAHAEGPRTLFFFNGAGNPVYLGHEWQTTDTDYNSVQATFGDSGGDTRYLNVELVYDHETFNTVTASREGGPLVTQTDSTEEGVRRRRVHAEYTDLILADDGDVESLAYHVLQLYKEPAKRPVTVTTNGHHALTHIMTLDIGHLIRAKKSGSTGDPVDRAAWIIGKRKLLDADRNITAVYNCSRGFDGATETAMAGITGYSEADTAKAA